MLALPEFGAGIGAVEKFHPQSDTGIEFVVEFMIEGNLGDDLVVEPFAPGAFAETQGQGVAVDLRFGAGVIIVLKSYCSPAPLPGRRPCRGFALQTLREFRQTPVRFPHPVRYRCRVAVKPAEGASLSS